MQLYHGKAQHYIYESKHIEAAPLTWNSLIQKDSLVLLLPLFSSP